MACCAGSTQAGELVILNYDDLVAGKDLSHEIAKAYGFEGLGLLAVKGVPDFARRRNRLLPLARKFALLPEETKKKCEHQESYFSFGWSHGKERFYGVPDLAKGSYYANPQSDEPEKDPELIKKYPAFVHPNIWPEDMPELAEAFKECGQLMVQVGEMVAAECDRFIKSKCATYEEGKLTRVIKTSKCCKGRLLHYFDPVSVLSSVVAAGGDPARADSWCGWHNDHGSLTALCPGMILNADGVEVESPDPNAGLFIHTRQGKTVKVNVPGDYMAFQIGETAQVHSGGILQATPHCVMGGKAQGVTRESFAVFMEPNWDEPMNVPAERQPSDAMMGSKKELLPFGVPMLEVRWDAQDLFSEFTDKTLKHYYEEPKTQADK
eukprot:c2080_g1_i1.p1 GENE.c2080_g1_i1~~c2080_g1_i1.p1  ORF type:complete len:379 (-),score=79.54 c2080_g1_i1:800-1936(-)